MEIIKAKPKENNGIGRCFNDDNRFFLPVKSNRRCPYCNEQLILHQMMYRIIKIKPTKDDCVKGYTILKSLKPSCGWNCSRKAIDELNANRTQEEIDKGIEYRRG